MVKKKALIIKSAVTSFALFSIVLAVCGAIHLNRAGVIAFCDLQLGSTLLMALIRPWMSALNLILLVLS